MWVKNDGKCARKFDGMSYRSVNELNCDECRKNGKNTCKSEEIIEIGGLPGKMEFSVHAIDTMK